MKDITLVAIEFQWYDLTKYAIQHSLKHIDPKEIIIISDKQIDIPGAKNIIRPPVTNISEYANIMLKGTAEHVNTKHALYVQWDGMANDQELWDNDFLDYDYIGAPWPWETDGKNIGNGGFSLRSKRLLDACQDPIVCLTKEDSVAEDKIIGNIQRPYLEEKYGIKFAPIEIAKHFSFELGKYTPSFGFHGLWNIFNFMSDEDMDYFVKRIDYKGWNIYKWHHVLAAVMRKNRMDIYEYMLNELIENSPELLDGVAAWLERDSQNPRTNLVID
jgi:hypothetical protein